MFIFGGIKLSRSFIFDLLLFIIFCINSMHIRDFRVSIWSLNSAQVCCTKDYNSLCRQNLNKTKSCAVQWLTVYLRKHVSFGEGEREEKLDDYHYLQQWRNNFQTHKRSCHRKAKSQFHSSLANSWVIFKLPTNTDSSLEMDYLFY